MMKNHHFSDQIKSLQYEVNGKDLEKLALENELKDVLTPSVSQSELTLLIIEMLLEQNQFVKKNGNTDRAKKSKERLLKILDLNQSVDKISIDNNSLKNINRQLHMYYQKLRIENMELKLKLDGMEKAFAGI